MKLNELLAEFTVTNSEQEIAGIAIDSRQVGKNYAFLAVARHLGHGMEYAQQAQALGACAILYDPANGGRELAMQLDASQLILIEVPDLQKKMPDIAARYYGYPAHSLTIIGITGTNGKTSCSQFLAQILTDSIVIGTLGWGSLDHLQMTGYTTPNALVLQNILADTLLQGKKTVVMEVSSHGVYEGRITNTNFKGAVFTNLSRDHLDYHGTMENYFQAKLGLFKRSELEFVVINYDDEYGQKIIAELTPSVTLWTFSKQEQINSARSVQAKNIDCSINGIAFEVVCGDETATIKSCLYGEFNVENMLAVLTTLLALGFCLTEAAAKVSALHSVSGRMEYFGGDKLPVVFVDFAHTPDALEKVLQSLRHHNPKSLAVVFGCGGNRDSGKRAIMGAIAEKLADKIIITDDNPRFEAGDDIVADILSGCKNQNLTVIRDRELAIYTAITQATTGDCIVIAGKGHENYQEVKNIKTLFSDQEVVKKALKQWTK